MPFENFRSAQPEDFDQNRQVNRPEVARSQEQFTGIPTVDRFNNYSDADYRELVKNQSIDQIIPKSKPRDKIRDALLKLSDELSPLGSTYIDLNNPYAYRGPDFIKVNQAIEKHLGPILREYKGRPMELFELLSQIAMQEKISADKSLIKSGQGNLVSLQNLPFKVSRHPPQKYDRSLAKMLKNGKHVEEIKQESEAEISNKDSLPENKEDAQGTLEAIDRLDDKQQIVTRQLVDFLGKDKLPKGVRLRIDPKDLKAVIRVDKLKFEEFIDHPDSPFTKESDGKVTLLAEGKTHTFKYDEVDDEYEMTA